MTLTTSDLKEIRTIVQEEVEGTLDARFQVQKEEIFEEIDSKLQNLKSEFFERIDPILIMKSRLEALETIHPKGKHVLSS